MPTIRNIDTIKATLLAPATTSHFDVEVGLPQGPLRTKLISTLGGTISQTDRLNIMCSEAVLPGSSLATLETNNDFTGVTERHAYRRIYDETIDLSFYVDAANYLPIKFFETWISEIVNEDQEDAIAKDYTYRAKYPDDYVSDQGLRVTKFERTSYDGQGYSGGQLQYTFVRSYPRSITSMPITYDGSSLLKCSVQMTYMRYVIKALPGAGGPPFNPFQQAMFNKNGLSNLAARVADQAVDRLTGNDFLGDVAGGLAGRAVRNLF